MVPMYGPCGRHSPPRAGEACWCCEMLKPLESMRDLIMERAIASADPRDPSAGATVHRNYHEWVAPIISSMARIEELDAPMVYLVKSEGEVRR